MWWINASSPSASSPVGKVDELKTALGDALDGNELDPTKIDDTIAKSIMNLLPDFPFGNGGTVTEQVKASAETLILMFNWRIKEK